MAITINEKDFGAYLDTIVYQSGYVGVKDVDSKYIAANYQVAQLLGFNNHKALIGLSDSQLKCQASENAALYRDNDLNIMYHNKNGTFFCFDHYVKGWELLYGNHTTLANENGDIIGTVITATSVTRNSLILSGLALNKILLSKIEKKLSFLMQANQDVSQMNLTNKQTQVLYYVIQGYSAKEVGEMMSISPKTVERHIEDIKIVLECHSKRQLIDKAIESGLMNQLICW